jgi:hypothetical protein
MEELAVWTEPPVNPSLIAEMPDVLGRLIFSIQSIGGIREELMKLRPIVIRIPAIQSRPRV